MLLTAINQHITPLPVITFPCKQTTQVSQNNFVGGLTKMGDPQYFQSYEDLEVHEVMLRDRPRQEAYYNAIMSNQALFHGKVVLDVGAGTGILSMFCARAGARTVYAVEASNLAALAVEVVRENQMTPIIKVFQQRIEDFQLPAEVDKVDIIVSEWMGFYLLHEGMLDSVIFARDRFLREGGLMFPENATIYAAPCSVPSLFDYWENVDGVQMQTFAQFLRAKKSNRPEIVAIQKEDLLHEGIVMSWIDLNETGSEDLNEISLKEVVPARRDGKYQGLCIWFECKFPSIDPETAVILSTSPCEPATHWKQCVIVLPTEACENISTGEPIAFGLVMRRNADDHRKYNIEMSLLDQEEVEHPLPCDCIMTKCILAKAHLASLESDMDVDL